VADEHAVPQALQLLGQQGEGGAAARGRAARLIYYKALGENEAFLPLLIVIVIVMAGWSVCAWGMG